MIARVHLDSGASFLVDDTREGVNRAAAQARGDDFDLVLYDPPDLDIPPLRRVTIASGTVEAVEDVYVG